MRTLALLLLPVLLAIGTRPTARAATDDRSLASLNTLTTSCNGGCKTNSACVVLGQSSDNPINCVSDARCATLLSGKAALCMEPFTASSGTWTFAPAKLTTIAGVAPFERVGLVQVADQVRSVEFKIAPQAPLSTLDISSLNVQSPTTLEKVSFSDLVLTGFDGALPVNNALKVAINNCRLQSIPTQFVASSKLTELDLSNNLLATIGTDFQSQSFPALTSLDVSRNALTSFSLTPKSFPALTSLALSNNQLREVPAVVFTLTSLKALALDGNPLAVSKLTAEQFAFLAKIPTLKVSNSTGETTSACPPDDVMSKLNASFTFCVGSKSLSSGSGSKGDGSPVVVPPTLSPGTAPVATSTPTVVVPDANTGASKSSSSSSTLWIVIGIAIGVLVLLVLVCLVVRRKRQRDESPKLVNSVTPSIAIGMGDLGDHPYMELSAPPPSSCSQTTSDFELLANVADGYIGLARLSYNDVFLHRMIRVSSRSELWFGEYLDASVIIKKIKSNAASKTVLREFVTEIEHMVELQHARIAAFRGAMWDNDGTELCAVVEYVEHGALRDCIASSVGLSPAQQLTIARQVVDALSFLHQKRIVHGRLNSFNVLLDKHYGAKLSLFAIFHYVKLSPLDAECGVFAAPEVLRGGQATEKSDVYSLGVLLVELDTGENPVINARRSMTGASPPPPDTLTRQIGFRLSVNCSSVMREVIAACLERDPARRPSMAAIANALKTGSLL